MKIVIPTNGRTGLDDIIAEHFGRSHTYTFLKQDGEVVDIIDNISRHQGGKALPPEIIKAHGASILLCRDIGPRALNLCQELGIDVYVYKAETVSEIFKLWQDKKLKPAGEEDACADHKH